MGGGDPWRMGMGRNFPQLWKIGMGMGGTQEVGQGVGNYSPPSLRSIAIPQLKILINKIPQGPRQYYIGLFEKMTQ